MKILASTLYMYTVYIIRPRNLVPYWEANISIDLLIQKLVTTYWRSKWFCIFSNNILSNISRYLHNLKFY